MLTLSSVQEINDVLINIFNDNYALDAQECQEFYHVSVFKKDKTEIAFDAYFPIYERFVLVDFPILVCDRLYFKIAKSQILSTKERYSIYCKQRKEKDVKKWEEKEREIFVTNK